MRLFLICFLGLWAGIAAILGTVLSLGWLMDHIDHQWGPNGVMLFLAILITSIFALCISKNITYWKTW